MADSILDIFAIGFAGCFIAVATHITFSSLYSSLFVSNFISRARVIIGTWFLLTSLANFAQYLPLGSFGCVFAAKLSIVTFHFQMLSGEAFQMYRISVITGRNKVFVSVAVFLLVIRASVMISDIVLSTSYSNTAGFCTFVQELYSGVIHVAMDAIVELFVTTAITVALFQHTQELKRLHRGSTNTTLYKIIIETNIFRTVILFLINLFTMLVIMIDPNSVVLTYMWSLMGIVYLYFVLYDKGMVRFLHQLAKTPDLSRDPFRRNNIGMEGSLSSQAPLAAQPTHVSMLLSSLRSNAQPPRVSESAQAGMPASIDDWADQYFAHLDGLSTQCPNSNSRPPMNIAIV